MASERGGRRAWAVTLILAALSMMSFLDRQVLAVIISSIRADMEVTDVQIGWLIGPTFFIVYNLTLIPAAILVDRWNRKWLIAIGVIFWSLMTMLSGYAQSYNQLLLLRAGVACGEALLGPAAISLIGDMFLRKDRPLPTAAYIMGSTIGSTGSVMISALVLQLVTGLSLTLPFMGDPAPWRLTLIGVGLPGLLLAAMLLVIGREPERIPDIAPGEDGAAESFGQHMRRRASFYLPALLGLALLLMNMSSIGIWAPTFLVRQHGLSEISSGYWIGAASLVGGVAGALVLPTIIRGLVRQHKVDAIYKLVLATMAGAVVAAVVGGTAGSLPLTSAGFGLFMFMAGGAGTMPTLIVQLYVPAAMRGRASAIVFFVLYLLAFGLSPVLVPFVATSVFGGADQLGKAIAFVAGVSGVLALLLFSFTRRGFAAAEAEQQA